MKKGYGFTVTLIVCFIFAGCAQQQVPPPYPRETTGSSPVVSDTHETEGGQLATPAAKPDVDTPAVETAALGSKASPLSAGFVNDRLSFYNKQLETLTKIDAESDIATMDPQQTKELFTCSRDLQRLIDAYQGFHDRLFQGNAGIDDPAGYENIIAMQRLDIAFLNGSCAPLLAGREMEDGDSQSYESAAGLQQVETEIADYFQNGAYPEVVNLWMQLPVYQHDKVDLVTAVQYADALMFLDQPARSAEIYGLVIDRAAAEGGQLADPLTMRKHLADLYTAAGNFFEAEKQYELLMEEYRQVGSIELWARLQLSLLEQSMKGDSELTDYTELLRSYLGYEAARDGFSIVWKAEAFLQKYRYSPVSDNVDIIKADAAARAEQWFASFILQADGLVADKQFQPAIELLQSVPADKLNPDSLTILNEKLDDLILAEAVDRETLKIEKMQELQRIWDEGSGRADSGDFDGAIEILGQLEGTDYGDKAAAKIDELALSASRNERRKAADLFVRATKTDDLDSRKQLLTDSRRVLKDILIKYPDVEVADKVRGNIRQVEKKMNEIDPLMLPEIEQQEREQQEREKLMQPAADDALIIEGFDVDIPEAPERLDSSTTVDQPKRAVLPVYNQ